MTSFIIHGQKITSTVPVIYIGGKFDNSFLFMKIWIHKFEGKEYQCAEHLSIEEFGQEMGGN